MAAPDVDSHSYHYSENFQISPQAFYQALEFAMMRRRLPGISQTRVEYREGGILSGKREYLRLSRDGIIFEICAAPFGTGFFVSWRLVRPRSSWLQFSYLLAAIAFLGVVGLSLLTLVIGGFLAAFLLFVNLFFLLAFIFTLNFAVYWLARGWLQLMESQLMTSPFWSGLHALVFGKETFYRIDTMLMFKEAVTAAIHETIATFTSAEGMRPTSLDAKPVMAELFDSDHDPTSDAPPPLEEPADAPAT